MEKVIKVGDVVVCKVGWLDRKYWGRVTDVYRVERYKHCTLQLLGDRDYGLYINMPVHELEKIPLK